MLKNKHLHTIQCWLLSALLLSALTTCSKPFLATKPVNRTTLPTYHVKRGEKLYQVALKLKVPTLELIRQNYLTAPYRLQTGQKLFIPSRKVHSVRQGESLYSISRLYGIDQRILAQLNKLAPPYILTKGQKLTVSHSLPPSPAPKKSFSRKKTRFTPIAKNRHTSIPHASFERPVEGSILSHFGAHRTGAVNDGINIEAPLNAPVKAAESGTVVYLGNSIKSFGTLLLIKHPKRWITAYAHLSKVRVREGETVQRGQVIAHVGQTGLVKSPQLHFEIRYGKNTVDPQKYIN